MNKSDEIWIPVGKPDHLNIPYFAMHLEGPEKSKVGQKIDPIDILVEIGNSAADWLIECEAKQGVEFHWTREYVRPKTAVYQDYLVFKNQKTADEFLDLFPEHTKKQNIGKYRNAPN